MGVVIKGCKLGYWTCLALVALAALAAGCGGGSSDQSEIESTLTGYIHDSMTGNWKGACEAMTKPASRRLVEGFANAEPAVRSRRCPEAMTEVSEDLGPYVNEALENVEIGEVKVSGKTATAEIGSGAEPVRLEKIDGSWYVNGGGGGGQLQIIH
jgi:hypothetical protein